MHSFSNKEKENLVFVYKMWSMELSILYTVSDEKNIIVPISSMRKLWLGFMNEKTDFNAWNAHCLKCHEKTMNIDVHCCNVVSPASHSVLKNLY